jgi:hypothetical protein
MLTIKTGREISTVVYTHELPDTLKSIKITFTDGREPEFYEGKEMAAALEIIKYWYPGTADSERLSDQPVGVPEDSKGPEESSPRPITPTALLQGKAPESIERFYEDETVRPKREFVETIRSFGESRPLSKLDKWEI